MVYLFSAYLILWGITFGYIYSLNARQKRLQKELELVRETLPELAAEPPEAAR